MGLETPRALGTRVRLPRVEMVECTRHYIRKGATPVATWSQIDAAWERGHNDPR